MANLLLPRQSNFNLSPCNLPCSIPTAKKREPNETIKLPLTKVKVSQSAWQYPSNAQKE